jgi:hypothetical protein
VKKIRNWAMLTLASAAVILLGQRIAESVPLDPDNL